MATNLVLADESSTNHTFVPERADGREAFYRCWDQADPNAFLAHFMGSHTLLFKAVQAKDATKGVHRCALQIAVPVGYEDSDGQPVPQGIGRFIGQWIVPVDMNETMRNRLWAFTKHAISATPGQDLLSDLKTPY